MLLQQHQKRLVFHLQNLLKQKDQRLEWLFKRIQQQHPGQRIHQRSQRLDEIEQRMYHYMQSSLRHNRARLGEISAHLLRATPHHRIKQHLSDCRYLSHRLLTALRHRFDQDTQRLTTLSRTLDSVSPLATLGRGYAIVRRPIDGAVIRSYRDVNAGDEIEARLARGKLICDVKSKSRE